MSLLFVFFMYKGAWSRATKLQLTKKNKKENFQQEEKKMLIGKVERV